LSLTRNFSSDGDRLSERFGLCLIVKPPRTWSRCST